MHHLKSFRTLNRSHAERKALYRNMVQAIIKKERIKTTVQKAKELRRFFEKLITKAKKKNLNNIRIISKFIKDRVLLKKLFEEIAPRFLDRNGGYTRVIKLKRRVGDGAELAYLELIGEQIERKKKKKKKDKEGVDKKEELSKDEVAVKEDSDKKQEPKKVEVKEDKEKEKEGIKEKEKIKEEVKEEKKKTEKKIDNKKIKKPKK